MLYPNGKIDHTITVTVTGSKQIRSGSDLTKSHDGMNHSRNRVRKTDQILNVTATTHKFQQRQKTCMATRRGIYHPWTYHNPVHIGGDLAYLPSNFARFIDPDW